MSSSLMSSLSVKVVSGLIVVAALGVGAGFGSLTSPDNPAHATTHRSKPTQSAPASRSTVPSPVMSACTALLCAHGTSGGGGNLHHSHR